MRSLLYGLPQDLIYICLLRISFIHLAMQVIDLLIVQLRFAGLNNAMYFAIAEKRRSIFDSFKLESSCALYFGLQSQCYIQYLDFLVGGKYYNKPTDKPSVVTCLVLQAIKKQRKGNQ